jgi:hypothetical protein
MFSGTSVSDLTKPFPFAGQCSLGIFAGVVAVWSNMIIASFDFFGGNDVKPRKFSKIDDFGFGSSICYCFVSL